MHPRRPLKRRLPAVVALLAGALLAVPVASQGQTSSERDAAEETLERVQDLAAGNGVRTGRELTLALAQLSAQRSALSRSDRATANALLARPTDSADVSQPAGPYSADARVLRNCSAHFCLHWVDSTNDAPSLANADACPTPDYIDSMRRAFEQSYAVENGQLTWQAPIPDGTRGGDGKTDVYVKDIGDENIYGYAAPDPGQSTRKQSAFQVMDDDYAPDEFPDYTDPTVPMRVTAAHEYNHILQFGYDALADIWMFESTATWAEDKVFDDVDDWRLYMPNWANLPAQPITFAGDGVPPSADDLKMYGSAIWNHWVERRYGADTVRRAWVGSLAQDGFAPDAYEEAIRQVKGTASFETDFAEFAAATAEWQAADSGIHEGTVPGKPPFPDVVGEPALSYGVARSVLGLDHTAYALYDVPRPADPATDVRLTGKLLKGALHVNGSVALVGLKSGEVTKVMDEFDGAGDATVTLADARAYDRLTAVIVNADTSNAGFDDAITGDWAWTRDDAAGTLTASQVTGATDGRVVDETGSTSSPGAPATTDCGTTAVEREPASVTPTPTPTPSATPTASPTVTPTPTPTPPTSLVLARSSTKLRSVARTGVLALFARTNKAGGLTAKSSVDSATAKRLKVGRRTTSTGTGRRTAASAGRFKVNVRLSRKARAALKRQARRTVRIKVRVTLVPTDGTGAVARSISLLLRP